MTESMIQIAPTEEEAKQHFTKEYPEFEIDSIRKGIIGIDRWIIRYKRKAE